MGYARAVFEFDSGVCVIGNFCTLIYSPQTRSNGDIVICGMLTSVGLPRDHNSDRNSWLPILVTMVPAKDLLAFHIQNFGVFHQTHSTRRRPSILTSLPLPGLAIASFYSTLVLTSLSLSAMASQVVLASPKASQVV